MVTTSTHDTKRSEDVRARLNVISELPDEWAAAVRRWQKFGCKPVIDGEAVPDPNTEYFLFQTLIGVWPMDWPDDREEETLRERVWNALLKSVREAKTHTSWREINTPYEQALKEFVAELLSDHDGFLKDFRRLQQRLAFFGRWNSLSQVILKAMVPGVPDFYQGTELWDLSLVDPDNRRPVDYDLRQRWLAELAGAKDLLPLARLLVQEAHHGRIKMYVSMRLLNFRREHAELFGRGEYQPITSTGVYQDHLVAFIRHWLGHTVIAVAPRWTCKLTGGQERPPLGEEVWKDTALELPPEWDTHFTNAFTGEILRPIAGRLRVGSVLGHFPVALLHGQAPS